MCSDLVCYREASQVSLDASQYCALPSDVSSILRCQVKVSSSILVETYD